MNGRPFRHLCPEADLRDAMTDDEFWAHVFPQQGDGEVYADDEPSLHYSAPCTECGEFGACGYDAEGRPLLHIQATEEHA